MNPTYVEHTLWWAKQVHCCWPVRGLKDMTASNCLPASNSKAILVLLLFPSLGWESCSDCWLLRSLTNPAAVRQEFLKPQLHLQFPSDTEGVQKEPEQNAFILWLSSPFPSSHLPEPHQHLALGDGSGQSNEISQLQMGEGLKGYLWATFSNSHITISPQHKQEISSSQPWY